MVKETIYLVVRADRTFRVAKKPRMNRDEVAIKVALTFPDSWGRVVAEVDLTMPEMVPAVEVEVIEPEESK